MMPVNYRKHGKQYDPDRYKDPVDIYGMNSDYFGRERYKDEGYEKMRSEIFKKGACEANHQRGTRLYHGGRYFTFSFRNVPDITACDRAFVLRRSFGDYNYDGDTAVSAVRHRCGMRIPVQDCTMPAASAGATGCIGQMVSVLKEVCLWFQFGIWFGLSRCALCSVS